MEPIAVGFMVLIAAATVTGVVVGAIGGAIVWRVKINLALGAVLTACAFLLVLVADYHKDFYWLSSKLRWGAPSLALAYLLSLISARWLHAHTRLHRNWISVAAFGISTALGLLYLRLFGLSPQLLLGAALGAGVCLVLLLVQSRKPGHHTGSAP